MVDAPLGHVGREAEIVDAGVKGPTEVVRSEVTLMLALAGAASDLLPLAPALKRCLHGGIRDASVNRRLVVLALAHDTEGEGSQVDPMGIPILGLVLGEF
jgi:hypothetical protein